MSKKAKTLFLGMLFAGGQLSSQLACAQLNGIEAYRAGNYPLASEKLLDLTSKDAVANYYLGRMHLYGYGELKNHTLAFRYLKQAAEKGVIPSQMVLGRYYLHEEKDPALAFNWFKKAANGGNTEAQLYCAAALLNGYGVKKNPENAWHYLLDSAKKNDPRGQYGLAEHFLSQRSLQNKKIGLAWLNKAVSQHYSKAEFKLASLYETGVVVKKDLNRAEELLLQSAKQGYTPAMLKSSLNALKQHNTELAIQWLEKAYQINKEDPTTNFYLGSLYLDNTLSVYKPNEGFKHIQLAAEKGISDAQVMLGKCYAEGIGTAVDTALAAEWQKKSTSNSKTIALETPEVQVAKWLSNDRFDNFNFEGFSPVGVKHVWKNPKTYKENNYNAAPQLLGIDASEIYKPEFVMIQPKDIPLTDYFDKIAVTFAKDKALTTATLNALPHYPFDSEIEKLHYREGKVAHTSQQQGTSSGQPENSSESKVATITPQEAQLDSAKNKASAYQAVITRLYNQAILGETGAQFEIGQLYEYGIGVAKNIPQALVYYRLAAVQQDLRAEYNLGLLYLSGKTEPVDYNLGIDWLTSAAFKGNSYAQYALAKMYDRGLTDTEGNLIVEVDPEQASTMYHLAAANDYGPAQFRLATHLATHLKTNLSVQAKQKKSALIKDLYQKAVAWGVTEAKLPLAFYDAVDFKHSEKQSQAFTLASQEARKGNANAALLMGMMLEKGLGVPVNELEALHWYQEASLSPVSAFVLGTYYSDGKKVGKDVEKAKSLLTRAAEAGFPDAFYNLAILKQSEREDFLPALERAREQGSSSAGLLLADYYLAHAENREQIKQAQSIYEHFANQGDSKAQLKLAYLLDKGIGGVQNFTLAEKWYNSAAEQGLPLAQILLAEGYQFAKFTKDPNYDAAKKWYASAIEKDSRASLGLGFIYDTVEDNYGHALTCYQTASKQSEPTALYNLGLMFDYGKGTNVNQGLAKEYYEKAAELGHSKAMNQLANCYLNGSGVAKNEKKARVWYEKAAGLQDPDALYQLGLLSETGLAGLQLNQAKGFYEKAATVGNHTKAKLALARMYRYGIGVEKNIEKANQYYQVLASNNNGYAQYQLALLHFNQTKIEDSKSQEGKRLLQQAYANGNLQAYRALQWLEATQQQRISFIEPFPQVKSPTLANQSAEQMYLNAISEWNRGNEPTSRIILNHIREQFPHYVPAKKVFEQLHASEGEATVKVSVQDTNASAP